MKRGASAERSIDIASTRLRRGTVGVTYSVFALAGYMFINGRPPSGLHLATSLDAAVPFWPASMWVYLSFYLALVYAAFMAEPAAFVRLLRAATVSLVVAWTAFLLFPTPIERPDPSGMASPFWRWGYGLLQSLDRPENTCPSLHVAGSVLVARALGGLWWMLWAAAVALSTLTTKQHFVADVVTGAVLALVAWQVAGRPARAETGAPAPVGSTSA